MQWLLWALVLVATSTTAGSRLQAQYAQPPGITAPTPLTRPPVLALAAWRRDTVFVWRHSYEGSGTPIHPSLWVVNGKPLGIRPDSSIDQELAKRELGKIKCRDVVSIDALKGAAAAKRFGPNVPDGVVLLVTRSPNDTDGKVLDEP